MPDKSLLHKSSHILKQNAFCAVLKDYGLLSSPFILEQFDKHSLLQPSSSAGYTEEQVIIYDNIRRCIFQQYQVPISFQQSIGGGKLFTAVISKSIKTIRGDLKKLDTIMVFLGHVNNICADAGLKIERLLIDSKVNGSSRKDIERDYKASKKHQLKHNIIPGLKKLIKSSGLSIKDLQDWQSEFAFLGTQNDDTKDFFGYMECIPLSVRRRTHGSYKLAMLYYDLSYDFEWILRQLGEKTVHLHTLVTNMPYKKVCVYCNVEYEPSRIDSQNCGKQACQLAYKNHLKRIQRRQGNYS